MKDYVYFLFLVSSKWNWSLHLFLGRHMFPRPFGLYCNACFGILFVSILCTCCSHFSWYCFISFTIFCAPAFSLIHWFFSLSSFVIPSSAKGEHPYRKACRSRAIKVAAPPLDSPCEGPVTYPGDIKTLIKFPKGRSGPRCLLIYVIWTTRSGAVSHRFNTHIPDRDAKHSGGWMDLVPPSSQ